MSVCICQLLICLLTPSLCANNHVLTSLIYRVNFIYRISEMLLGGHVCYLVAIICRLIWRSSLLRCELASLILFNLEVLLASSIASDISKDRSVKIYFQIAQRSASAGEEPLSIRFTRCSFIGGPSSTESSCFSHPSTIFLLLSIFARLVAGL